MKLQDVQTKLPQGQGRHEAAGCPNQTTHIGQDRHDSCTSLRTLTQSDSYPGATMVDILHILQNTPVHTHTQTVIISI